MMIFNQNPVNQNLMATKEKEILAKHISTKIKPPLDSHIMDKDEEEWYT